MAQPLVQPYFHPPLMHHQPPAIISVRVPNRLQLDFVCYTIDRERFGETDTFHKYEMDEGADGDFMITLPRPPGPLNQWLVSVYGFREGEEEPVFISERPAWQVFPDY